MDYNGKELTDNHNKKHTLSGDYFASGGEGELYCLDGEPEYVAKIYYPKYRTGERHKKLKAMIQTDHNKLPECAWPVSILYEGSEFCGFVMRKISGYTDLIDFYVFDNRNKYTWAQYVTVAMNIAAVVSSLHELGHIVGDLNSNNILVDTKSCKVAFVDTDSYHIRGKDGVLYPCVVATPDFSAPELQGVDFQKLEKNKSVFNTNTDNFSLAILIFRLLMNGVHPFACTSSTVSVGEFQPVNNIKNGYCAYFTATNLNGKLMPTPQSPQISMLPSKIQMMFKQAMLSSAYRPNGEQWFYELLSLRKSLCKCPTDPRHEFYSNLEYCPWCYVKKELARRMNELKNRTRNRANKATNVNGNFESYDARYGTRSNTVKNSSGNNNQAQTRSGVTPPNSAAFNKNNASRSTNTNTRTSSSNTVRASNNSQPQTVSNQQDDSSGTGGYILGIIILSIIFLWDLPSTIDAVSGNSDKGIFLIEGLVLVSLIILIRNYVKRKKGQ